MEEHSELSMEPLSAARMATNPISEASKAALRKSLAESGKVADYDDDEICTYIPADQLESACGTPDAREKCRKMCGLCTP